MPTAIVAHDRERRDRPRKTALVGYRSNPNEHTQAMRSLAFLAASIESAYDRGVNGCLAKARRARFSVGYGRFGGPRLSAQPGRVLAGWSGSVLEDESDNNQIQRRLSERSNLSASWVPDAEPVGSPRKTGRAT
jgi:hypothetical protein